MTTTVLENPTIHAGLINYQNRLRGYTHLELQHAAEVAEAQYGQVGDLMRHLVDEEREYRIATRHNTTGDQP